MRRNRTCQLCEIASRKTERTEAPVLAGALGFYGNFGTLAETNGQVDTTGTPKTQKNRLNDVEPR